jgi:hypothetical protein
VRLTSHLILGRLITHGALPPQPHTPPRQCRLNSALSLAFEGGRWMQLAQDRVQWWGLVLAVLNLEVLLPRSVFTNSVEQKLIIAQLSSHLLLCLSSSVFLQASQPKCLAGSLSP